MMFAILLAACSLYQEAAPARRETPAQIEAEVHRRYLRLEALMGRLLAALKEPERGGRLQVALARARELKVADRLEAVRGLLERAAYREALGEEEVLEKDLERLLAILRGEDPAEAVRESNEALRSAEEELQRLERLIEDQRKLNEATAQAASESADRKALADRQQSTRDRTDELRRTLERKANVGQGSRESRGGQGKQGQAGQEGQGGQEGQQGKQGQAGQKGQEGQPGEQGQQGQEGQQGSASPGRPGGERPEELARGALRKASQRMGGAAQRIESGNPRGAVEDQEEALAQLQRARDALERERERLEEEKQEAIAAAVLGRLQAMLSEQKLIRAETEALHARATRDPGLSRETRIGDARGLARRERTLGADADDVIRILEEEGSTLVAPPILRRVKDDLESAARLLDGGETGAVTRSIQADVETALEELIDALRPPRRPPGGGGGGGGRGRRRMLITPAMEVRMLASAQRRIRVRTERIKALPPPEHAEQAARVAEAEGALGQLTEEVTRKYPFVDSFILGEDNGDENEAGDRSKEKDKEAGHGDDESTQGR